MTMADSPFCLREREEYATLSALNGLVDDEIGGMMGSEEDQLREVIRRLFDQIPDKYAERVASAKRLRTLVQAEIGRGLEASFNAELSAKDLGDTESRREAASWANEQLHDLGLGIRCPRTQRPSILLVDIKDKHDTSGRFRLGSTDASGFSTRSMCSTTLPRFELTEAPPRVEPLARRHWRRADNDMAR